MASDDMRHYLARARDFRRAVELLGKDTNYRCSAALLAIHVAISYSDALRTGLGGGRMTSEDHRDAANRLQRLLVDRKYEKQDGIKRFERLVAQKSVVAYGNRSIDAEQTNRIIQQTERFTVWAETAVVNSR